MDMNMVYWIGGVVVFLIALGIIRKVRYNRRLVKAFLRQMAEARSRGEDVVHWDPSCVR